MTKTKKYELHSSHCSNKFRSGFVAIIGAPNVGKSTLLNSMLNRKISITSKKAQTTRNRILGILTESSYQIAFVDTPGIHKSSNIFNKRIVDVALTSIEDVDLIIFVIDASNYEAASDQSLIKKIRLNKKPVILVINKIDKVKKSEILKIICDWSKTNQFKDIVPICALRGYQIKLLVDLIQNNLSEGPQMFPRDIVTDLSKEFVISEIIREKVLRLTDQEVPYSVVVTIDSFKEKPGQIPRIYSTINVERNSQKGIIIGKNGTKLGQISEKSRLEIQKLLGSKVFIKLFVRIQKNWSKDTKVLERFGY